MIDVMSIVRDCSHTKDNYLLALAIDGRADFLLTRDKHLLDMIPIVALKYCLLVIIRRGICYSNMYQLVILFF